MYIDDGLMVEPTTMYVWMIAMYGSYEEWQWILSFCERYIENDIHTTHLNQIVRKEMVENSSFCELVAKRTHRKIKSEKLVN